MSQPHIFVSHSHKDEAFTGRLVADLRAAGAEVWVDDAAIQHGNFPKHISDGLSKSEWLVLVLTPNAIASEWVQEEVFVALALVKQKRMQAVIPLLALPCEPATIPPLWSALHTYDAVIDYAGAVGRLCSTLGLATPVTSTGRLVRTEHLDQPAFGVLLRRFRRAAGLSQIELAERVGLSLAAVMNVEGGKRPRNLQVYRRLVAALPLSPQELALFETAAREPSSVDSDSRLRVVRADPNS